MNALRNIWPTYLTGFVIACSMLVGFILGVNVTFDIAKDNIAKLEAFTLQAIREKGK